MWAIVGMVTLLTLPRIEAEPLSTTQLHATMGIVTNFILSDGIVHNGTSYGKVTSPYTGRVWLDRNLGASRVCTSLDDTQCYGDYYQWGRGFDGHQNQNSALAATLIGSVGHGKFVINSTPNYDWTSLDSTGAIRQANWIESDGSSICPLDFRVPTITEIQAELTDISSAQITNSTDAFDSFLKLPSAGDRISFDGSMDGVDSWGFVWSSSASGTVSLGVYFDASAVSTNSNSYRAHAHSVRCIKKIIPEEAVHKGTVYGTVTSPYTGKVWLDRNLGANRICTSFDDTECFGDYYQWGRNYDGHQESTSSEIPILATNVNSVGYGDFITIGTSPYDWASVDGTGSQRLSNWSKTDASSVCPIGFRVPTITELSAETLVHGVSNRATAFSNFLKFPSAGYRSLSSGSLFTFGTIGFVWTNSINGTSSRKVVFDSGFAGWSNASRANGYSLRCLKD
jgi:hypothetical protein